MLGQWMRGIPQDGILRHKTVQLRDDRVLLSFDLTSLLELSGCDPALVLLERQTVALLCLSPEVLVRQFRITLRRGWTGLVLLLTGREVLEDRVDLSVQLVLV